MNSRSRGKLVRAGYRIFRMRDVYAVSGGSSPEPPEVPVAFEIREMSLEKGEWGLYARYATKAARRRAWDEIEDDDKNITEGMELESGRAN